MLYADYNLLTYDNINYTVDMLRLKTLLAYSDFSKLEYKIKTLYKDMIKKEYVSGSISDFKYNYNIEIGEGQSFWFGFIHNSEIINKGKSISNDSTEFNFTIEFNPNKIPIKRFIKTNIELEFLLDY